MYRSQALVWGHCGSFESRHGGDIMLSLSNNIIVIKLETHIIAVVSLELCMLAILLRLDDRL